MYKEQKLWDHLNLQLFAEEDDGDDDLNLDDEDPFDLETEEDDEAPEGETEEEKKARLEAKKKAEEEWYLPGVAKTKEALMKQRKKERDYVKKVEAKNKALSDQVAQEPKPAKPDEPVDEIAMAIKELGITDDELVTNPLECQIKIAKWTREVLIPAGTQVARDEAGGIRAEILKKQIKETYPNFDIDANELKVADILRERYAPAYIQRHSLKLISGVVEELGGKKGKTFGVPHSEEPTEGGAMTKTAIKFANKVRDDIRKVKVGSSDISQL